MENSDSSITEVHWCQYCGELLFKVDPSLAGSSQIALYQYHNQYQKAIRGHLEKRPDCEEKLFRDYGDRYKP